MPAGDTEFGASAPDAGGLLDVSAPAPDEPADIAVSAPVVLLIEVSDAAPDEPVDIAVSAPVLVLVEVSDPAPDDELLGAGISDPAPGVLVAVSDPDELSSTKFGAR